MSTRYNPSIVRDNLVLYLDAANTKSYPGSGTTWTDISRKGTDGTLTNGATFNSGNMGHIAFDGTNDYVDITSLPVISNTSAMTMEAWVNVDNLDNEFQCVGTWERANKHWQFTYSGSSSYNLNMSIAGSQNSVGTTAAPATGVWQCVAVTFTGGAETSFNTSTTSIYVNAVSQSIQNTGGTGTSGNDSYIGTRQGFAASNFLDGSIALIRYYDKALTEAEIRQNFEAQKGRFGL